MERPQPLHVLVVEDDPDTRANLRDILELDAYEVALAGSAAECLGRTDWSRFSAILLDRRLLDGTAEDLLPQLQQRAPQAQVLIITGYVDVQGAIAALRLGAADYLLKPIHPDELRARLGHIARRIRSEEQIRLLATIPAESPHPMLRVTGDGLLLYANSASAPLLTCWEIRVGQPLPDPWRDRVREVYQAGAVREVELRCGSRIFVLVLAPVACADHVNLYGRDITTRKQAQEALRAERDFAEGLIETAQAVVLVLDPEGRILRFNRYLEELAGFRLEEVRGQDWFSLCTPEEDRPRLREAFQKTLAGLGNDGLSCFLQTRAGNTREIQWGARTLRDDRGQALGVLVLGHDITDLREAQRRALQAERLAALGQMMAVLAHEGRNALQQSWSYLTLLKTQLEDHPEALELANRVVLAQRRLRRLFDDLQGYAAPLQLERAVQDVSTVWRQAWDNLALVRQGREAVLHEETAGIQLECAVDYFRLEQVFRNILENALSACPDPVRIEVRCAETTLAERPALRVAVRDNGPGLTAEQRVRIFEPFFTTKAKGTGLGMAIARRMVEAHGGQLAVRADSGPGAEIVLTLPREAL